MENEYLGYKEVVMNDEELSKFFETADPTTENLYDCKINEYVIAKDTSDEILGMFRWDGERHVMIDRRPINCRFTGKIRARNPQQALAIDMLSNDDITVKMLAGKFGSGKTFLMSAAAVAALEDKRFERIVYIRNNIEVKNSKPIGFLPGTYNEKMMPFAAPLADHLGGFDGLNMMIARGQIEIAHLGFIRGRDIKNSIIFCSEAENLTKEHIQLLISRVGDGSALWLDGDIKQRDADVFMRNSGMAAAIERLSGHPRFGYVKLQKTERSETAAMADLLD